MKRICVNVSTEMAAGLKEKAAVTGVPQAEQIRRAINLALFADQQADPNRQPVLFAPRRETR
jgi:Ribbon-helix-helix protein, copG family